MNRPIQRPHAPPPSPSANGLTPARRHLLDLMQRLYYGRIESLAIRGGEPDLGVPPRVVREIKFGGENALRPDLARGDFHLKSQVVDLFREFDRLRDGVVLSLEVHNGLPFRMSLGEAIA